MDLINNIEMKITDLEKKMRDYDEIKNKSKNYICMKFFYTGLLQAYKECLSEMIIKFK